MTKLDLMKMLENVDDNAELTFVENSCDRDGYPAECKRDIYKVLGGKVVEVRGEYSVSRYENLTDDIEYVSEKNLFGIEIGYYQKKRG